jgi:hypothetical protein
LLDQDLRTDVLGAHGVLGFVPLRHHAVSVRPRSGERGVFGKNR